MYLYFVRHGDASHNAPTDAQRPLTDAGCKEARLVGQALAGMKIQPTAVLSSPRVRAQQTADLIADALSMSSAQDDALNFHFNLNRLEDLLASYESDAHIVLVGHNPNMSEVAQAVTGARVSMKTGMVIAAHAYPPSLANAQLLWAAPPKLLKALVQG